MYKSPSAIAIVSPSNCLLLIKTCHDQDGNVEEATKLTYLLHACLDIVEEKAENHQQQHQQQTHLQPHQQQQQQMPQQLQVNECFLGVLYQSEQHKIFGHLSVTKVKILILFDTLSQIKETEVRQTLKSIHKEYVDVTAMNPFYKHNDSIKSKKLHSYLNSIIDKKESYPVS